jgi:alkylation response protein AidB-like acyl-CoA dehydrogenase
MDFSLSAEQQAIKKLVIQFATEELNDGLIERDRQGIFDRALWRKCGQFGIQGLNIPKEYGGKGEDLLTTLVAMEALGYGCRDNGMTFALNSQMWSLQPTLLHFASENQKQRYLPSLCRGDTIGCYAITEPEFGSDAYSIQTRAEKCDGGYLLNGSKMLVTFAPVADFALVFATTSPERGKWGLSSFLIDKGTEGFEATPVEEKMGLRTVPIGRLIFNNCFVPEENRVGPEGAGASIFNSSQEWERICILASQVGAMEAQLEKSIAYARQRQQFGQQIGKFQSISNRIAEMKLRLEASRLLMYRAAWLKQLGKPVMLDAALANLYLGEAFVESSLDAIRIHGGRGYLTEFEVERDLRDAVGGTLYGGTSDIQRNIIARLLGL